MKPDLSRSQGGGGARYHFHQRRPSQHCCCTTNSPLTSITDIHLHWTISRTTTIMATIIPVYCCCFRQRSIGWGVRKVQNNFSHT